MAEQRVAVVTEFAPDDLPTGVQRRYDHLVAALRTTDADVVDVVLSPGRSRRSMGLRERLRAARSADRSIGLPPSVPAVVVGLGTPTMAVAARRLRRGGRTVALDESDSVLMQLQARIGTRSVRLIGIALWQLALHLSAPSDLGATYISARDADADRAVLRRRPRAVVPPSATADLARLEPVQYPLTRIVVPVELASHHSAAGYRMLVEALAAKPAPVPVEIWGPTAPASALPTGAHYAGFAPNLADVYAGDTAVVVVNVGGSGVPNKLVEAAAAGRPALVHASIADRAPAGLGFWRFEDADELAGLLGRAVTEPPPGTAEATRPSPEAGPALLDLLHGRLHGRQARRRPPAAAAPTTARDGRA